MNLGWRPCYDPGETHRVRLQQNILGARKESVKWLWM